MELNTLLTVKDACIALQIGRTKIYELIRSHRIRSIKLGERTTRIPSSEIQRIVREVDEGAIH